MGQLAQIVLASRTEEENQLLRRTLATIQVDRRDVVILSVHHQSLAAMSDPSAALVVLNYVDFGGRERSELEGLRASGYDGSVIVMASDFGPGMKEYLRAQNGLVTVEKSHAERDLVGIVRKLLTEREVAQRMHRRFRVSQDVEISAFGGHSAYTSRVCNLSVGGAYLEFMSPPALVAGELVRVRFELSEMNRIYTMPARVVWSRRAEGHGEFGLGVEFIGPGDVKMRIAHS